MSKNVIFAVLLVLVGVGGALMYLRVTGDDDGSKKAPTADFCAEHQIAEVDCPWCDASLIESKGMCPEHGVLEALCASCNPALIAGFKAERDWCAGHETPESQCELCKAGHLPPGEEKR